MIQKKQKLFLGLASFLLIFICFSFVSALEVEYPEAGGIKPSDTTTLPQYITYLFNFSIGIAGIIAFGVLVWSGIKILTSPDQPETVKDARTHIMGAFLGIIILLSSYLILTTINPQLKFVGLDKSPAPVTGVYLTDASGKDHYVADSSPDVGFIATAVKFISPPSELIAVYDSGGTGTLNPGAAFSGKSIYFLWNKPGIYLYPAINFQGQPLYFNSSVNNLSGVDFDKKTKSVKFVNSSSTSYGAIFFTESDWRGECGFVTNSENIADIDAASGSFYPYTIRGGGLSSFRLLGTSKDSSGNVIFYGAPNCQDPGYPQIMGAGGTGTYQPDLSKSKYSDGTLLKNHIISLKINGSIGVILSQKEKFEGRCQFFTKPAGDNCYPSLESTYLWGHLFEGTEYAMEGVLVGSFGLFPLAE
jgi:hypothetical protein